MKIWIYCELFLIFTRSADFFCTTGGLEKFRYEKEKILSHAKRLPWLSTLRLAHFFLGRGWEAAKFGDHIFRSNLFLKMGRRHQSFINFTPIGWENYWIWAFLAAAIHYHSIVIYKRMHQPGVMQGSWSGIAMKGFEPATCGSVFWSEASCKKGSRLGQLRISRLTYCLTSCSSVVRALVCQPSA